MGSVFLLATVLFMADLACGFRFLFLSICFPQHWHLGTPDAALFLRRNFPRYTAYCSTKLILENKDGYGEISGN